MTETEQAAKYEAAVTDYMEETGCDRITAEILVEQSAGENPDAWWSDTDYSDYQPRPLCE